MKTHELIDSWSVRGDSIEEFSNVITDLADSTYVVDARTCDLTLLHYNGVHAADENRLTFTVHSREQVQNKQLLGTFLDLGMLEKIGVTEEFVRELQNKSKLMLRLGGVGAQREDFYFTSPRLSRDLSMRGMIAGDAVYDPTNERDMYIMSRYIKAPVDTRIVIRRNSGENNAVQKIFAMPTSQYNHFDQRVLLEMLSALKSELGKFECRHWRVDHFLTQIWVTFPEQADDISVTYGLPETMIPGVLLETSDTGDCSLRTVAFWEHKRGSYARIGSFEREHRGKVDAASLVSDMQKKLLPKYTELPARLCDLLTIDLPDPAAAIEAVFVMGRISKHIGKRRAENLQKIMTGLVESRASITAYEVAMMFMDMPSQYSMDDTVHSAVEEVAGSVPFLDFNKIAKATTTVTMV